MIKLDEALKVIRDECKSHGSCRKCPLRTSTDNSCGVTTVTTPEKWQLASDPADSEMFRVFR